MPQVKKHWTQTAKGRRLLSVNIKKYHAKKRKLAKNGDKHPVKKKSQRVLEEFKSTNSRSQIARLDHGVSEAQVAYAFGNQEAWLRNYADRNKIPFASLARRVAELLHVASRG